MVNGAGQLLVLNILAGYLVFVNKVDKFP